MICLSDPTERLAYSTAEVARLLGVSTRTVERLPLKYLKVGRLRRYRREDVLEYLEARVT